MPGILAVCRINLLKLVIDNFSGLGSAFLPHPLCPPLLPRRGGEIRKRGFASLGLSIVLAFSSLFYIALFNSSVSRNTTKEQ